MQDPMGGYEPDDEALKVMVAYANYAAGQRASALLQRVARQCVETAALNATLWKFDLFQVDALLELAVADAVSADIIIISGRDGAALPDALRFWLERWLAAREPQPQALVAALEQPEGGAHGKRPIQSYLRRVTRLPGVTFIAGSSLQGSVIDDYALSRQRRPRPIQSLELRRDRRLFLN